jgi:hypothetical protein
MAIEKELLDQLLGGRDPNEVLAKGGLLDEGFSTSVISVFAVVPLDPQVGSMAGSHASLRAPARPKVPPPKHTPKRMAVARSSIKFRTSRGSLIFNGVISPFRNGSC